jgi:cytochrome c2
MRRTLLLVGLSLLLLAGCAGSDDKGYKVAMLVMPDGHPQAGREAFVNLGCPACHSVTWDEEMQKPVAAVDAPELDKVVARTSAGMLATAIVCPSHYVPWETKEKTGSELSPMGEFTEAMTVQELIDVVAYLKAQQEAAGAPSDDLPPQP